MTSVTTPAAPPIICAVCAAENRPNLTMCRRCSAPLALGTDPATEGRQPQIITVIGESYAGKTVYLGMLLDMLSQRPDMFDALPKGSFSVELQQNVISHLAERKFPPKTPTEVNKWRWAWYEIRRKQSDRWLDLVMPDMAGEALATEVATPETFRNIRSLLNRSRGILLCIDAAKAARGIAEPDLFALKVMSYVDSAVGAKRKRRIATPVAVVLCKSDYCPEAFDDPPRFAEANLNRLWNVCQSRFEKVGFFAASVVGSVGYATTTTEPVQVEPIPLHTAPRGILEPFEWLLDQLAR